MLRMLMVRPATITQIGERLGKHPAWVRHHVQALARAGLAELTEERVVRNYTEKYYAATAQAFEGRLLITPVSDQPVTLVALGSHDFGLDALTAEAVRRHIGLVSVPVGSLDGLIALRQGLCDIAGCHLLDPEKGEYNTPFLQHLFPDIDVVAITLAEREQGIVTRPGAGTALRDVTDLPGTGLRFANRNPGSGTRVWRDARLKAEGVAPETIFGYDSDHTTHTAVAGAVARGDADAGLCLRAAAEAHDLAFRPLFHERYDLVMRRDRVDASALATLLDDLGSKRLRRAIGGIAGYDTARTGQQAGR
jgi:putative molybdopterin biosynthesis protein